MCDFCIKFGIHMLFDLKKIFAIIINTEEILKRFFMAEVLFLNANLNSISNKSMQYKVI